MARTEITVQDILSPFAAVAAGAADYVYTAGDIANGNTVRCTGAEIILVQNTGASPYYITINSVDDDQGRQEDINQYSLAAGDFVVFGVGLTTKKGWINAGYIDIDVENAGIEIAVLRLP